MALMRSKPHSKNGQGALIEIKSQDYICTNSYDASILCIC